MDAYTTQKKYPSAFIMDRMELKKFLQLPLSYSLEAFGFHFFDAEVPSGCDRYYFELIEFFRESPCPILIKSLRIIIMELLDFLFPSAEMLGAYLMR